MASQERYEEFVQNVQKKIDDADRAAKQSADAHLKAMADNFKAALATRLKYELAEAEGCRRVGDELAAKHHDALAFIYRSLIDAQVG